MLTKNIITYLYIYMRSKGATPPIKDIIMQLAMCNDNMKRAATPLEKNMQLAAILSWNVFPMNSMPSFCTETLHLGTQSCL